MATLAAHCAHESRLRQPAKDGTPVRVHLEGAAARGLASAIKALEGPECPDALEYLWSWFQELERVRTFGAHGPDPITYQQIEAWARLMNRRPTPDDVQGLLMLDAIARNPQCFEDESN